MYCLGRVYQLSPLQRIRYGMKIWDKRGTTDADASTIFSMALKYLKEHLMKHFTENGKLVEFANRTSLILCVFS